jgi:hypothetical protein
MVFEAAKVALANRLGSNGACHLAPDIGNIPCGTILAYFASGEGFGLTAESPATGNVMLKDRLQ